MENIDIYGRYKNVRDSVWQLLIDYKIKTLPISLYNLCAAADIKLIENSTANELQIGEYGVAIRQGKQWYIIFDDTDTPQRIRYTIAHELGHIFLGHDLKNGYHTRKKKF